jgi:thermitase
MQFNEIFTQGILMISVTSLTINISNIAENFMRICMNRSRIVLFIALLLLLTTLAPPVTAQQSTSGYYYYASGQVVNLQTSADFIAVSMNTGMRAASVAGIRTLSGVGDVSRTIELDSPRVTLIPLAPGSNGITTAHAIQTAAAGSIEWAMPVFQYLDIYHVVTDRFLASFPSTMTDAQVDAYNANYGVQRLEHLANNMDNLYLLAVTRATGRNAIDMANVYQTGGVALYASPEFVRLEQNASNRGFEFVPNDPSRPSQWHLNNTAQFPGTTSDADIDAFEAWDLQQGANTTKIAIMDSGVEITHPDLASQIVDPYDPVQEDFDPTPNYLLEAEWFFDGHGTLVAGLAAGATNNSTGIAGVCPNCRIMPIRIARTIDHPIYGLYTPFIDTDIIQSFDWARTHDAAVMNNSWGGGYPNSGITNAINNAVNYGRYRPLQGIYLGAVVVFAAGNDFNDPVIYPANLPNVMAVGATNMCDGHKSPINDACNGNEGFWGSSAGPEMDISAPGVRLFTTDLTDDGGENYCFDAHGTCDPSYDYDGYMNGTSGASPIVSGVAGLVISENPNLTQLEVQNILMASADDIWNGSNTGPGWDSASGWGRVNAYQALQLTEYLMIAPTTPVSPVVPERPILTWTDYLPANWYYIEVRNATTNAPVATQYFSISQANCAGTCTGQITTALPAGTYKYRLIPVIAETGHSAGSFTPFSANFTIGAPTNLAPAGTSNAVGGDPTYSWTGLAGATHYYLLVVNSANQVVINEVIDAAGYCAGVSCNFDPTDIRESARLVNGTYRFWIRPWLQNGGTGALSTMGWFTLTATPPVALNASNPGTFPAIHVPSGLSTLRPTFDWDAPEGATWMHLLVVPAAGGAAVQDRWISRTEACGSPSGTVCHITANANLVDGVNYKYYIQTYGPGGVSGWSPEQPFTVDAPTPATPSGLVLNRLANGFVQAQWNDDPNVLWYGLLINTTTNVSMHNQWYQRTGELCNAGVCRVTLTANFVGGNTYRMYMAYSGDGGTTAWTQSAGNLADSPAAPVQATLISPITAITTDRPSYQWNEVANASWYYLYTSTGQGTAWYNAQTICNGVTCTVTPAASIGNGNFTWYVSSFGPGGMGPASANQAFSLGIGSVPVTPFVNNPGTVTNPNPNLTWTRDADPATGATMYHVYLSSSTAAIKNAWYHVSQICDPTTCVLPLNDVTLANGNYSLYIQGYNPAGVGPWSSLVTFAVNVPAPDAPTLVAPTGGVILLTNRPTFTWNSVPNATFYHIELINSVGTITLNQWIATPTICTATCVFTPTTVVPYGIYTWHVQGYSQGGIGSFSTNGSFYALSMSTMPQMVQSNDGVLRNPGNWSAVQDANAIGGSYAANAAGTSDAMMFTFDGTGIDVVYIGGAGYGSFIVEIDGYANQTVNSSYADTHYGLAVQIQGLAAGQHTLRIIPVNGSSVAIDAFYVAGTVIAGGGDVRPTPITPVPTAVPTEAPTLAPTEVPTEAPTEVPTEVPTEAPTEAPTETPTEVPTEVPTETPVP